MSYWRERAVSLITDLVKDLPDNASAADRAKLLRGKGWPAHQGTSWGRKMWGKEVRNYLMKHGATPRVMRFQRYSPITGQYEMVDLYPRRNGGSDVQAS